MEKLCSHNASQVDNGQKSTTIETSTFTYYIVINEK